MANASLEGRKQVLKDARWQRSLGYRNYNPLNIRANANNKWLGQQGAYGGFCVFSSFSYGFRAAVMVILSYQRRGIRAIGRTISEWAPMSENDTEAYIKNVVFSMQRKYSLTGETITRDTLVNLYDRVFVVRLLLSMAQIEMGASAQQIKALEGNAEVGYDLAVTSPQFRLKYKCKY